MPDSRPPPKPVRPVENRIWMAHRLQHLDEEQQARIAWGAIDHSRTIVAPDEPAWNAIQRLSDECMAIWSSDPVDDDDETPVDIDDTPDALGPAANALAMALFAFARGKASGGQHRLTPLYFSQAIGGAIFAAQVARWMRDEPDSYTVWLNHGVPDTTVSTTMSSVEVGQSLWNAVIADLRSCDPYRNATDQDLHQIDPELDALTTAWKDAAFEVTGAVVELAVDAPGPTFG